MTGSLAQFAAQYAVHRAAEGRGLRGQALRSLPYLRSGPLAQQWSVRARSFDFFLRRVVSARHNPLHVLDLGAGNCWLCFRLACLGHAAVGVDIRGDDVDGLGAAADLLSDVPEPFQRVIASFEELPFAAKSFDVTVFNASLHYARDLSKVLQEAMRVTRSGGLIVVMDSPFYRHQDDGEAMIREKRALGQTCFGPRAAILLNQKFIEYLTRDRLSDAWPELAWFRHRVWYPLWYEMRAIRARLARGRRPSRFDIWTAQVP